MTASIPGHSLLADFAMHARTVGAVVMRDLQTRFGGSYYGFLLGLIFALGHLGIVIAIYSVVGRTAPLGTDTTIFVMTGVLPFIIWLYSHRQMMMSLSQNRPLLYFPGVTGLDILLGRAAVEIVTATIITSVFLLTLSTLGSEIGISDVTGFFLALLSAYLLGLATGMCFGLLGAIWHPALYLGNLCGPFFWAASGVFFLPAMIPENMKQIIYFFPLAQIIDFARMSYYASYSSEFFDQLFLTVFLLIAFSLALVLERVSRKLV